MLMLTQQRERASAVEQVLDYMRRRRLTIDDLVEIGGKDLRSRSPRLRRKVLHVEKCWALMAHHGVKHADLAPDWASTAVSMPAPAARRRRHRRPSVQAIENAGKTLNSTPLEIIEEFPVFPVGAPELNSEQKAPTPPSANIPNSEVSAATPTRCSEEAATMPGDGLNSTRSDQEVSHE
jgi:hypothetical protein